MSANSWNDNALRNMRKRTEVRKSRQAVEAAQVTEEAWEENPRKCAVSPAAHPVISSKDNDMQRFGPCATRSERNKTIALNYLRGVRSDAIDEKSMLRRQSSITPSRLMRWCKFNVVGGIGILVQFAALFVLKSVLHFNYLFATVIAVEAAVVHNFVWHEQFTWADKVQRSWSASLPRLLRFNLTNGAVSILGNLALMKVMVGMGHLNYLLANAIAISLCSVANFLVSEEWVFAAE